MRRPRGKVRGGVARSSCPRGAGGGRESPERLHELHVVGDELLGLARLDQLELVEGSARIRRRDCGSESVFVQFGTNSWQDQASETVAMEKTTMKKGRKKGDQWFKAQVEVPVGELI